MRFTSPALTVAMGLALLSGCGATGEDPGGLTEEASAATASVPREIHLFTGTNHVVCGSSSQVLSATCTRAQAVDAFRVILVDPKTGEVALRRAGAYVALEAGGTRLIANSTSIGTRERFKRVRVGEGLIALRASNGLYVAAEGGGGSTLVANRTAIGAWETFREVAVSVVALQAYSKHYVVAEGGGDSLVLANRTAIGGWETFRLLDFSGGRVALQASNGKYVAAENGGGSTLVANRSAIGGWELFQRASRLSNGITLQASNGRYVSAENGGGGGLVVDRLLTREWETFGLVCLRGEAVCNGACVDFATDSANCGRCGTTCSDPYACHEGACRPACGVNADCPAGWVCARGALASVCLNPLACTSSADCSSGAACVAGSCVATPSCDAGAGTVCVGSDGGAKGDGGVLADDSGVKGDGGVLADDSGVRDGGVLADDSGVKGDGGIPVGDGGIPVGDGGVLGVLAAALSAKPYTEGTCQPATVSGWPHAAQTCSYTVGALTATVTMANPPPARVASWIVDAAALIPALEAIKLTEPAEYQRALLGMADRVKAQSGRVFPLSGDLFEGTALYPYDRGVSAQCTTCYCRINSLARSTWCKYQESRGQQTYAACTTELGTTGPVSAWNAKCLELHRDAFLSSANQGFRAISYAYNATIAAACPPGACTAKQVADVVVREFTTAAPPF